MSHFANNSILETFIFTLKDRMSFDPFCTCVAQHLTDFITYP